MRRNKYPIKRRIAVLLACCMLVTLFGNFTYAVNAEEEQTAAAGLSGAYLTEWYWNDTEQALKWSEEKEAWQVSLTGGADALKGILPKSINAETDGGTQEIGLTWDLSEVPEDGAAGEYTVWASTENGSLFSDGSDKVAVTVLAEAKGNTPKESAAKSISSWNWVDENEIFVWSEEKGGWIGAFPGAAETEPMTKAELKKLLPKAISADIDGKTEEISVTWDLTEPPESFFEGSYVLTAQLPEGYQLGEGAKPLNVTVSAGGVDTLLTPENEAKNLVDETVSPRGTTINLFDYWTEKEINEDGDYWENYDDIKDKGINKDHQLKFTTGGGGAINVWTGSANPRIGMVSSTLTDGYPQLKSQRNTSIGITRDESLSYLFDESAHEGKKRYPQTTGLLQTDSDGYYYYDSAVNFASFDKDSNSFKVYNEKAVGQNTTPVVYGNFFPFNTAEQVFSEDKNGKWTANERVTSKDININHYFGMTMTTRFIHQDSGYTSVSGSRKPVTYEFTGDDDVWVFIDDVLVGDLGGNHSAASLKIDFSTGQIQVNGSNSGTLYSKFQTAGKTNDELNDIFQQSGGNYTFKDGTYHTLKFFYLERGNVDSNCKLKFNLVTIPETDIVKIDQSGNSVPGAEFELYEANADYTIKNENSPIATGTTGDDGTFALLNKDGTLVKLSELYKDKNIRYLVLRETKVPDGYRSNGDIPLNLVAGANDSIMLLSANYWENGAFASGKELATAPNQIYTVDGQEVHPETSGTMFSVVLKYTGTGTEGLETNDNWKPVSGSVEKGWMMENGSSIADIIAAAKKNPYIYKLSQSGQLQVAIDDLPGDIADYYFVLNDNEKEKTKYTVGHYYTSADSLESATTSNTWRLDSDDSKNNGHQKFQREFAANLYVPNIKNYLAVEKEDETGSPVTGATFSLYEENNIKNVLDNDGYVKDDANLEQFTPVDTAITVDELTGQLKLKGAVEFPSSGKVLKKGTYYLVETAAPKGYKLNQKAVKIICDDSGVYADAGTKDDGVAVSLGVGSLVKTMIQFAVSDDLDTSLHDIQATLSTADQYEGNNTSWKTDSDAKNTLHLQYGAKGTALEYGPETEGGAKGFFIDSGWGQVNIRQCFDHDGKGEHNHDKTDLKNTDLSKLFSRSTIVRVTNQRLDTLTIEKEVTGIGAPADASFPFEVALTDQNDNPVKSQSVTQTLTDKDGTSTTTTVNTDENGKLTVNLKDGEKAALSDLEVGWKWTVTETLSDDMKKTYDTSVQVGGDRKEGATASGELLADAQAGANQVLFTNAYKPSIDFTFKKVKAEATTEGLNGAEFTLYELNCKDSSHTEADHSGLIDVKATQNTCWTVKESKISGPSVTFTDLYQGEEYRLVETKAPAGRVLPKGQWKVTVGKAENSDQLEVKIGEVGDQKPPAFATDDAGAYSLPNMTPADIPSSGGRGILWFMLIGGLLAASGGALWIINQRKQGHSRSYQRRH
ncbi:SpaA isopeptide-forming pilin-related protein [Eubacterium sp.]|uniref:SpaA isopeptide-forming pilin-related protein n=1 Tax=Eubacterium sp. TaxID=142586 RepID=UPI0026DEAC4F|nr:SpaA isopeptide-forming pilin-related protein [Eubacterium sp.]MDO5433013.1 SpaA isopeptide-forming pilin-related protein [Eubacterium sp.]